ncbi:hypothetical protein FVE85_7287 [Porphyridium purpureum]|uniref:Metallothionein n=1 Tax=Porphyridium purpureum TaxID=35688 RepID=A0A5J4Z9F3_PORPP|nr:hypothetical protein FVE85_7287 [Porphyridium purpureum]|eukprot:POR4304..scf295_1
MCGAAECPCCDQSDCNCGPSCGCGKGLPRKTKEQWLQSYARYAGKAPAMCGSCKCREGGKCACRSTGKCH